MRAHANIEIAFISIINKNLQIILKTI